MAIRNTLSLKPITLAALQDYVRHVHIDMDTARRLCTDGISSFSQSVIADLTPWLGPNGLGPNRHSQGNDPYALNKPAFAGQFIIAFRAMADMPLSKSSRDTLNSYKLKHSVEDVWRKAGLPGSLYICNGAIILAVLVHGYPVRDCPHPDKINAAVRFAKSWQDVMLHNLDMWAAREGDAL